MNLNLNLDKYQGQMNHMALQLAILLVVPLIVGLAAKFVLSKFIRLPNSISSFASVLILLFVFYKMIFIVLG